jgi:hypothetical protein
MPTCQTCGLWIDDEQVCSECGTQRRSSATEVVSGKKNWGRKMGDWHPQATDDFSATDFSALLFIPTGC